MSSSVFIHLGKLEFRPGNTLLEFTQKSDQALGRPPSPIWVWLGLERLRAHEG